MITSQTRLTALFLLCLAAFALAGCGERYSWKQKITVSVETPQGPVSASSVQKVSGTYHEGGTIGGTEVTYSQTGEAVVLQVGPGRYLFALLTAPEYARAVWKDALPGRRVDYMRALSRADDLQATVRPQNYPLLVTFDDIDDPASVKRVDPANLAASFGPGYALKSITLEITDEPVTEGKVEEVLGWLSEHPEPSVMPNIKPTDFSFEAKLRHGDFIRR